MSDKSFVSMEQQVCLVCGIPFDTGSVLIDKRLRARMERHTTTGWGLCAEHQRMSDDGYIALIECDPDRSGLSSGAATMKPEQAYRTGRLAHLKREFLAGLFNRSIDASLPCVFVDPGVIDQLQTLTEPAAV